MASSDCNFGYASSQEELLDMCLPFIVKSILDRLSDVRFEFKVHITFPCE